MAGAFKQEMDSIPQTLSARIRELAERYDTPLPELQADVDALSAKVAAHLKTMGASWT